MTHPFPANDAPPTTPTGRGRDAAVNPLAGALGRPTWLQQKVRRQAAEIRRLTAALDLTGLADLATMYVSLQARMAWMSKQDVVRREVFVKGYHDGWRAGFHAGRHTEIEADPR